MQDVDRAPADGATAESDDASASAEESATVAAPSVLAVVVAHEPGPWFDEVLAGLAAQDYSRLSVLVVDTADDQELAGRVASLLPEAILLQPAESDAGYGAAANLVLDDGPRAALYLFCHDDVALAADAVTHLVDEVVRSNAAIVAPKLVMWDDPQRLQHVGLSVDKFAMSAPLADEGEIDQAQRDAVTDVFAVPGACMLVRADLFRTLGGFDAAMEFRGDDVDLCWRAQLAGARVMVVPDAVARHRERLSDRRPVDDAEQLGLRNSVRSMLSCWGWARLVRIVPQAVLLTIVEIAYALAHGRVRHARALVGGWTWNLRRLGAIHRRRKAIAAYREVDDVDVHRLQVRGSARLRMYFRGQLGRDDERMVSLTSAGRELASSLRTTATRNAVVGLALLALVVIVGSRHFFTSTIPGVGELQPLHGGTRELLAEWWRGWHTRALGSSAAAPTASLVLGLGGIVLFGHAALLRTVLLLVPLPIGGFGMWRLARPFGSRRGNLAGTVVYVATPIAYNGYAQGSLGALAMFAAAPWMLGAFARVIGTAPFAPSGRRGGSFQHRVTALGLLLAIAATFAPFAVAIALVIAGGLFLGALVAGDGRGSASLIIGTPMALVLAFVLHLPWSLSFVQSDRTWASFAGPGSAAGGHYDAGDLLRLHTGPFGAGPLSYAVLAAAGFSLLLARGERLAWTIRAWFVALSCWALLLASEQGWLPRALPNPGVVLAPAAAALALATALGVAAFEVDLRRHRFGWRQFAPFASVGVLALLLLPFVAGAADGRWKMPRRDFTRTYAGLFSHPEQGTARVLWIGDPLTLPLAGFDLARGDLLGPGKGLAFTTTDGRAPTLLDGWGGPDTLGARLLRESVALAANGDTNRLGRLLAIFGVRYLVLADHTAPAPFAGEVRPIPDALRRTFEAQLDLERVEGVNDAVTVYRNNSWLPVVSTVPAAVDVSESPFDAARHAVADTSPTPLLTTVAANGIEASGVLSAAQIAAHDRVLVAANTSAHWRLSVGRVESLRGDAYGWANVFSPTTDGPARLRYETPLVVRLLAVCQIVVWSLVLIRLNTLRERRRRT